MERVRVGEFGESMYKIVDESILFFSRVSLSKFSSEALSLSALHFVGIKVFIAGCEMECEKSLFSKTGCTGESLATGMSHKFQLPITKLGQTRPNCTFCLVVIQLS